MEAKIEATEHEFQAQLKEVEARAERGRTESSAAMPPKFFGTTSWAILRRQFEIEAEHNC
jgi:hypothetical protein